MVARRLRARALFLDADRVHLRALALVAHGAARYGGRPALATWLAERVDRAAEEVLAELERETREGARAPTAGVWVELAGPLGLAPAAARAVCVALCRRSHPEREAFLRLVLRRESLDELAHEAGVSASAYARRARSTLDAVLSAAQDERN